MSQSEKLLVRLRGQAPAKIDLSLDRTHRLLDHLGNPQHKLPPVVHIAGTNGKGSTIAFLSAILQAGGRSVHSYTSPYLHSLHDSIRIGSSTGTRPISEARLAACLDRVAQAGNACPVTLFEAQTVAAFLAFSEAPADIVLLETGLGGRLDATNIFEKPVLTILTPISSDHTEFLGNDIADIAAEKAGILKPGVTAVVARQTPEAYAVIARRAGGLAAPLYAAGRNWDIYEQHGRLVFQGADKLYDLPCPSLHGHYQIENAGTAVAAALSLKGYAITEDALDKGLTTASWPGRLQRLKTRALLDHLSPGSEIWLDGGHNPAAATALAHAISDLEERAPKPLYVIASMLSSKDPDAFFHPFRGLASEVIAVELPETGSMTAPGEDPVVLAGAALANGIDATTADTISSALEQIGETASTPVRVLICGSLHLVSHTLRYVDTEKAASPK